MQIPTGKSCGSHLRDSGSPGIAKNFLTWCHVSTVVRESLCGEAQAKQELGKAKSQYLCYSHCSVEDQ